MVSCKMLKGRAYGKGFFQPLYFSSPSPRPSSGSGQSSSPSQWRRSIWSTTSVLLSLTGNSRNEPIYANYSMPCPFLFAYLCKLFSVLLGRFEGEDVGIQSRIVRQLPQGLWWRGHFQWVQHRQQVVGNLADRQAIQRGFIFGDYTLNEQQTAQVRDILEVADACPPKIGHASIGTQAAREYKPDRKSTRLNSSHANISYAVFC